MEKLLFSLGDVEVTVAVAVYAGAAVLVAALLVAVLVILLRLARARAAEAAAQADAAEAARKMKRRRRRKREKAEKKARAGEGEEEAAAAGGEVSPGAEASLHGLGRGGCPWTWIAALAQLVGACLGAAGPCPPTLQHRPGLRCPPPSHPPALRRRTTIG